MITILSNDVFEVCCDECLCSIDCTGTFQQTMDYIRDEGWKSRKIDDEWAHVCPDCQDTEQ